MTLLGFGGFLWCAYLKIEKVKNELAFPSQCDCGTSFANEAEVLTHPPVFVSHYSAEFKTTFQVLACSKTVLQFKESHAFAKEVPSLEKYSVDITTPPSSDMMIIDLTDVLNDETTATDHSLHEPKVEMSAPMEEIKEMAAPVKMKKWPRECKCGAKFSSEAELLGHPDVYDSTAETKDARNTCMCSDEVMAFKKQRGANAGFFISKRNMPKRLYSATILDKTMTRCGCGARFKSLLSIVNHPDMFEEDAAGNHTYLCSSKIALFKQRMKATPGCWIRPKSSGVARRGPLRLPLINLEEEDEAPAIPQVEVIVPVESPIPQVEAPVPMEMSAPAEVKAVAPILPMEVKAPVPQAEVKAVVRVPQVKTPILRVETKAIQERWPSKCRCGAYFESEAEVLGHLDLFYFGRNPINSWRSVSKCSKEVIDYKKKKGANPGYRVRRANPLTIGYPSMNVCDGVRQCNCGTSFKTTLDIITHPDVYNGNGKLLCSANIVAFKKKGGAKAGYLVRGTLTRIPKLPRIQQPMPNNIDTRWPKQCNCGTKFTSETAVLNHPQVFKQSVCICSDKVTAFKNWRGGVDPGCYFWQDSTPLRICKVDISHTPLKQCACGMMFASKLDILNHPDVFDRDGKLLCSDRIVHFKRKLLATPGYWVQNSPSGIDLNERVKELLKPIREKPLQVKEKLLQPIRVKQMEPIRAVEARLLEPIRVKQVEPIRAVEVKQVEPIRIEEWPSECKCGAKFVSEAEVLAHPAMFKDTLESPCMCSDEVTAFKKEKRSNPGYLIRRRTKYPPGVCCTAPAPGMEKCACGAQFETNVDILLHPITYRTQGQGRVLLCSENIVKFKGPEPSELILPEVVSKVVTPLPEVEEYQVPEVEEYQVPEVDESMMVTPKRKFRHEESSDEEYKPDSSDEEDEVVASKVARSKRKLDFSSAESKDEVISDSKEECPRQNIEACTPVKKMRPEKPTEEPMMDCPHCSVHGFATPLELANHLATHETPLFVCACRKHFTNKQEALDHAKVHSSGSSVMCEFVGCNKRFVNTADLKHHITENHVLVSNINERHHCMWPGCGNSFVKVSKAKEHMQQKHTASMNFSCVCGQRLPTDRDVRQHVANEMHFIKRHNCTWPECGKEFLSSLELRHHLLTH